MEDVLLNGLTSVLFITGVVCLALGSYQYVCAMRDRENPDAWQTAATMLLAAGSAITSAYSMTFFVGTP